jgi:hypothetical protein
MIRRIEAISDLQFFRAVHGLEKETAETDQFLIGTEDQGELRR